MAFAFKFRKSAGVPVTAAVHRLIARGNRARHARDWRAAADAYGMALAADPSLGHIWLQHGHMLKEAGDLHAARAAYDAAVARGPADAEPHVHLGHLARLSGDRDRAARHFLAAVRLDPAHADAATELHREIGRSTGAARATMTAWLRDTMADLAMDEPPRDRAIATGPAIVFDVSDLIAFYGHDRLPTGIQRVQIEAILGALADPARDVRICCFIDGREDWLEVPPALFRMVTDLSVTGGERNERAWVAALNRLRLTLTLAEPFEFPFGAWLVNLGTSWWLRNYFLYVRHAKATRGIRYVPFVHDFIPVITPEHCVTELTQDFISWAIGVFAHADHFLVNSESTRRDLVKVAAILGHAVTDDRVAVIRLDADFRKNADPLPPAALARFGLADAPYVLFVSTIESRKGHAVALDAWAELIRRHGAARVPKLVCVGRNGWLNDDVYARLAASPALASRVTMLSRISDAELALLYRQCRFTIYPSLYEGWGLPVTEALCWGKPVISADSSSLPEAGGDLAVYVPTGAVAPLADAVERMAFDADWREGWEAKIAAGFKARSWHDIAAQIAGEVVRLAEKGEGAPGFIPPPARLGRWHALRRSTARRIWPGAGSAEIFRAGLGWLWPDADFCWTRPGGGTLAIGIDKGHPALRVHLLLRAMGGSDCPWRLRIKGRPAMGGTLPDGGARWIGFDYPAADDGGVLRLHLSGETAATVSLGHGQGAAQDHAASIGLCGFFLCEAADADTRAAFVEAAALGSIDQLDAYAETVTPAGDDIDWEWEKG